MYYPFGGSLATLDHQLSNALLAAPVTLASGNPVLGHNVFLLTTFVLSGFTMFLLVRALTGSGAAGLVAGGIFAFAPFRMEQIVHTPIMASFWLPLLLLATHRYVLVPSSTRSTLSVPPEGWSAGASTSSISAVDSGRYSSRAKEAAKE